VAFYTYIMASGRNGTVYVGMTDDLRKRVGQHRRGDLPGFTRTYGVKQLVWFEMFELRQNAFRRERRIKEWPRAWKLHLIEEKNPQWDDLGEQLNDLLPF